MLLSRNYFRHIYIYIQKWWKMTMLTRRLYEAFTLKSLSIGAVNQKEFRVFVWKWCKSNKVQLLRTSFLSAFVFSVWQSMESFSIWMNTILFTSGFLERQCIDFVKTWQVLILRSLSMDIYKMQMCNLKYTWFITRHSVAPGTLIRFITGCSITIIVTVF